MTDTHNNETTNKNPDIHSDFEQSFENNVPEELHDFTENSVSSYVKLSDKYNDIMSSATTMLFVGIIGTVFMILVLTKIISLPLNPATSWLFYSVMGGIFIIFIVSGIVSFMHAKQVKIDADAEDKLIEEILVWSDENFSTSVLDKDLDLTQPDEILYFSRADKIASALMHQFENADESLITEMTEQVYQKLYETSL
jgi:hypothetical protein